MQRDRALTLQTALTGGCPGTCQFVAVQVLGTAIDVVSAAHGGLLRRATVIIEQPAESRSTANPRDAVDLGRASDECVVESLVIALTVVVRDVFRNRASEMPLPDRNRPIETLLFNGSHEAFGVGIRIGRPIRRQHDADARLAQSHAYGRAPLRIAITEQHAMIDELALTVNLIATELLRAKPARKETGTPIG